MSTSAFNMESYGVIVLGLSSFGEDARGELYIVDLGSGEVYRIVPGR